MGTALYGLRLLDTLLHLAGLDAHSAFGLALLLAVAGVDHPRVGTAQELTYKPTTQTSEGHYPTVKTRNTCSDRR